jgi:hypothetical protein
MISIFFSVAFKRLKKRRAYKFQGLLGNLHHLVCDQGQRILLAEPPDFEQLSLQRGIEIVLGAIDSILIGRRMNKYARALPLFFRD